MPITFSPMPTNRSRQCVISWKATLGCQLPYAIGYEYVIWKTGMQYPGNGFVDADPSAPNFPDVNGNNANPSTGFMAAGGGLLFDAKLDDGLMYWQANYGEVSFNDEGILEEFVAIVSYTFLGCQVRVSVGDALTGGNQSDADPGVFWFGPVTESPAQITGQVTVTVHQRAGFTFDEENRSGRQILQVADGPYLNRVLLEGGGVVYEPDPMSFTYSFSVAGFSGNGTGQFNLDYSDLCLFNDSLTGYVSKGTISGSSLTTVDGNTVGFKYAWNYPVYATPIYLTEGGPGAPEIVGQNSGSIGATGLTCTLVDNGPVITYYGQDFTDPDHYSATGTGGYDAALGYCEAIPDFIQATEFPFEIPVSTYQIFSNTLELKGQFRCFADDYPDNQAVSYTGDNPANSPSLLSGSGALDKLLHPLLVLPSSIPGLNEINQKDYFHAAADGATFAANGDIPNYELPIGRAFQWPAATLSVDKSTDLTPDNWQTTGGAALVQSTGQVSFRVSGPADTILGQFAAIKWHLAWRYEDVTISAEPDDSSMPPATVRYRLNSKGWTFTTSEDPYTIDTCEPNGVYDYQDGQDSLWPLVPITWNGVTTFVPSQERDHWGCNYLTEIVLDNCQPGYTYTVETIKAYSIKPMEVECLPAQGDLLTYRRSKDEFGIYTSDFAKRGLRVQIDGRLALEFPWQIILGSPVNPPSYVPIPTSPIDGSEPTDNLFDYINSIDGFTLDLAEDTSQFFNHYGPLDGFVDDLFAHGAAWDGTQMQDGTTIVDDGSVTFYYGCVFDDLDTDPAQGDVTSGANYGNGKVPVVFNFVGHFRDRAWGISFNNGQPDSGTEIDAYDKVTGEYGGSAVTRDDGWFETALPYLKANRVYLLDPLNCSVTTWGRRSDRPTYLVYVALESGNPGFWLGITFGTPIVRKWWHSDAPGDDFEEWVIDTDVNDAINLSLAYRAWDHRLLASYASKKAGAIFVRGSYDFGITWFDVFFMANLTEYVIAVNPNTQETNFAYRNEDGFVVVDVFDLAMVFVGTYPDGGIPATPDGSPIVADSPPAICYPRDGNPACQLSFVSGGVPLRFGSLDDARTFFPIPMSS